MAEESINPIDSLYSIESIGTGEKQPKQPVKKKRVMSEAQLNNLKLAREKAALKRKELGETTQKEKELDKKAKDKLLEERISKIKTLEAVVNSSGVGNSFGVVKSKPKQKKKIESSSSESRSSEEEEIKPKPKQLTLVASLPIRKPKAIPSVKDKSSDDLAIELSKQELKDRFIKNAYSSGFKSLFPGHENVFG